MAHVIMVHRQILLDRATLVILPASPSCSGYRGDQPLHWELDGCEPADAAPSMWRCQQTNMLLTTICAMPEGRELLQAELSREEAGIATALSGVGYDCRTVIRVKRAAKSLQRTRQLVSSGDWLHRSCMEPGRWRRVCIRGRAIIRSTTHEPGATARGTPVWLCRASTPRVVGGPP